MACQAVASDVDPWPGLILEGLGLVTSVLGLGSHKFLLTSLPAVPSMSEMDLPSLQSSHTVSCLSLKPGSAGMTFHFFAHVTMILDPICELF